MSQRPWVVGVDLAAPDMLGGMTVTRVLRVASPRSFGMLHRSDLEALFEVSHPGKIPVVWEAPDGKCFQLERAAPELIERTTTVMILPSGKKIRSHTYGLPRPSAVA